MPLDIMTRWTHIACMLMDGQTIRALDIRYRKHVRNDHGKPGTASASDARIEEFAAEQAQTCGVCKRYAVVMGVVMESAQ